MGRDRRPGSRDDRVHHGLHNSTEKIADDETLDEDLRDDAETVHVAAHPEDNYKILALIEDS